jgi:hypothetical protein
MGVVALKCALSFDTNPISSRVVKIYCFFFSIKQFEYFINIILLLTLLFMKRMVTVGKPIVLQTMIGCCAKGTRRR